MNRSYSKIRHIQEANQRLEKRVMSEQFLGEMTNYEKMKNYVAAKSPIDLSHYNTK